MEATQTRLVSRQRAVQSQAAGENGNQLRRTSLRQVAPRNCRGQGRTRCGRRTGAREVESKGPKRARQEPPDKAGAGDALAKRDHADDSRDCPTLAHGELEKL